MTVVDVRPAPAGAPVDVIPACHVEEVGRRHVPCEMHDGAHCTRCQGPWAACQYKYEGDSE